jgi:hypothetical protein
VSATVRKKREARKKRLLQERQRRILKRLANSPEGERPIPMMTASNIHYELGDRVQGISAGGIGAMLLLARRIGLIEAIDAHLHLLKVHLPYHESDHVLNIAFNALAGGKRIEHLELRRNDEVYRNLRYPPAVDSPLLAAIDPTRADRIAFDHRESTVHFGPGLSDRESRRLIKTIMDWHKIAQDKDEALPVERL